MIFIKMGVRFEWIIYENRCLEIKLHLNKNLMQADKFSTTFRDLLPLGIVSVSKNRLIFEKARERIEEI